jgi:hypothetical protein
LVFLTFLAALVACVLRGEPVAPQQCCRSSGPSGDEGGRAGWSVGVSCICVRVGFGPLRLGWGLGLRCSCRCPSAIRRVCGDVGVSARAQGCPCSWANRDRVRRLGWGRGPFSWALRVHGCAEGQCSGDRVSCLRAGLTGVQGESGSLHGSGARMGCAKRGGISAGHITPHAHSQGPGAHWLGQPAMTRSRHSCASARSTSGRRVVGTVGHAGAHISAHVLAVILGLGCLVGFLRVEPPPLPSVLLMHIACP